MKVSIKDVAAAAGVSKTTASDAMNNLQKVNPATREKVWEAARQLGYKPNIAARELITNKRLNLGIVNLHCYKVEEKTNDYFYAHHNESFYDIASVIMEIVSKTSYGLLTETIYVDEAELSIPQFLKTGRVAGVFVVGTMFDTEKYCRELKKYTSNIVLIGNELDTCDSVLNDYREAIYCATEYLIQNGHTDIGLINGDLKSQATQFKYEGFSDALLAHGINIRSEWITNTSFTGEGGYLAVKKVWEVCDEHPTALCFSADIIACGAMRYFYEKNIRVPEEVSIISYENSAIATFAIPPLTVIDKNKQQMGKMACKLMFDRLEDESLPYRKEIVPFSLMERQSVVKR